MYKKHNNLSTDKINKQINNQNMTSLDTIYKNNLYHSHDPVQYNPNTSSTYIHLRYSVMSQQNKKLTQQEHRQNKISYKYQRIDNIFRLVKVRNDCQKQSIQSNQSIKSKSDASDPKQQSIKDINKIQTIYQTLHNLTTRIISLELQQAKATGLQKRITDIANQLKIMQTQGNYFSDKITGIHHEIVDLRERLEEVEEQGGSYQKQFADIFKLIGEIKEQTIKVVPQIEHKYQQIFKKMKQQLEETVQSMLNSPFKNMQSHTQLSQHLNNNTFNHNYYQKQQKNKILKYRQTYETYTNQTYLINQNIYKIDPYGKLLDISGFILLDKNNKQVKLSQQHVKKLCQFGILKNQDK